MIPDNVTLIVKAPNQQIDDQNIECQSSWTVRQLKGYLADVYPTKPRTDEQRIIYSGQLLDDNTILKDVLRTYDNEIQHTMHLVCTPTRKIEQPVPNTDGLRHRTVEPTNEPPPVEAEVPPEPPRPETRQNDQNHNVEMQNYLTSFVNNYGRIFPYPNYNLGEGYLPVANNPAQLANHMMVIQQAYIQYMEQYAYMWQVSAPPPAPEPPAAPVEAPTVPPEELDEPLGRDWLDHLYAGSRLAILFSLVYLYGSPARLLLVMFLVAAGYLHQIGFFRDLHVNQPNGNRRNEQPAAENRNQPAAENRNQPAEEAAAADAASLHDNPQSLLAVTWMIFTSFFASLIPDTN